MNPPDSVIRELLVTSKTIAVVGLSSNPERSSNGVAGRLQAAGYRIIPVNPNEKEVWGERAYADLASVPVAIDIVDVFRRPEYTPPIAADAVKLGARALWLQQGVVNEEAERIARAGGLIVVMDACLAVMVSRMRVRVG
ncbi:MAG TPA: CoA-binding protein [Haliangiales bacterium]|nr:CoA-binding protein [Haliangiales bacterium]